MESLTSIHHIAFDCKGAFSSICFGFCLFQLMSRFHLCWALCFGLGLVAFSAPISAAELRPVALDFVLEGAGAKGADTKGLAAQLRQHSELERAKATGLASLGAVKRVGASDLKRFRKQLYAEGFYGAQLHFEMAANETGYVATFHVEPGRRFSIVQYEIHYEDEEAAGRPQTAREAGVEVTASSAIADVILVARAVIQGLQADGYPRAKLLGRRAKANFKTAEARIVLFVESGPRATFGPVAWSNEIRTQTDYLQKLVPWEAGQNYDLNKTAVFRDALAETGLFASIAIEPGETQEDGQTPVEVSLVERKPRTFGAGLSFSSNRGMGAQAAWTHRNLLRRGEVLGASLSVAELEQELSLNFRKPAFLPRTDLVAEATTKTETTDAFDGTSILLATELQRQFSGNFSGRLGVELYASQTEDTFGKRDSYLLGFPVGARWAGANSVLNPTEGLNVSLSVKPHMGASNGAVSFALMEGVTSYYKPFDEDHKFVAAVWTRLGASIGPSVSAIPPDKRYYSGGGGSVRGYGYRLLGPTDADGDPIGGRSVFELGTEFRFPVRGNLGGAIFLEGGSVSTEGIYAFDEAMRFGAGAGVRYYTKIGPIRADVGVPLDRRQGVDGPVQFYISLGQAF